VVLRGPADEKSLLAFCREHMAAFKVPSHIHIVAAIPRTATGKVQRRFLADAFAPK
jgi:acyl-coenzyme A synthetase/AMP-(fatty) acid ligase